MTTEDTKETPELPTQIPSIEETPTNSEEPLQEESPRTEEEAPLQQESSEQEESPTLEEEAPAQQESSTQEEPPTPEEETPPQIPEEEPILEVEAQKEHETLVNLDLMNTEGRWLIKVVSGPNTGAEFAMHAGTSYIIGSDAKTCDIIFQDMSVSRKHAKITIDESEKASVEDLSSRNGTFVDNEKITHQDILGNVVVSVGTTTFLLLDREAEQTTIVAKKMHETAPAPSQEPQADISPIQSAVLAPMQSEVSKVKQEDRQEAKSAHAVSSLVLLAVITAILMIAGVAATFLFRAEEISAPVSINPDAEISKALAGFPTIRFSYNPINHRLLLVGHLLSVTDRSKLLDRLQQLPFISGLDYNNVVIDELVWRDFNQTLAKNPAWKGITVTSPEAGRFVVSGFLQTKNQASELSNYISQNFPYIDLLERKIVVEEDLLNQIKRELNESGFKAVTATISGGDLTLSGAIAQGTEEQFAKLCTLFKSVPGVRSVQVLVSQAGQKEAVIDLSTKYAVQGFSKQANKRAVVIGGRFLSVGDVLDGMSITSITDSTVYLERNGVKYKIDFNP